MPRRTISPIKGTVIRLIALDTCGNPVSGSGQQLVTDGFISVNPSPSYTDPEEIQVRKADGSLCVNETDDPELQNVSLDTNWCVLDPDAISIVTGEQLLTDGVTGTGMAFGEGPLSTRYSLEIWQRGAGFNACNASGEVQYVYWAFPNVGGTQIGDFAVENAALEFTTTSTTKAIGQTWLAEVDPDWLGTNVPDSNTHFLYNITTVAPPAVTNGAVPL